MATKNQNILSLSRLSAALLLLVLLLVNVLFARQPSRIDLTEEGKWTLAEGSKQILAGLRDPARIRVFWGGVPDLGETQRLEIDALLEEMEAAADGRLRVRWVDMTDEDGEQEASEAGIQKTPFQSIEADRVEATEGWDSLIVEMGDEEEIIPRLVNRDDLEYVVVSTLHRMSRTEAPVVGLVLPTPSFNPMAGRVPERFGILAQVLEQSLGDGVRRGVDLSEPVPPETDVLVVVAPEALDEVQAWHLEQFLLREGRVILCLDPVDQQVAMGGPGSTANRSGLEDWLAHLGVTVESGVVGDAEHRAHIPRPVQTQMGTMLEFVPYPFWPIVTNENLDPENPVTRRFAQVPLYWPAALSLDHEAQKAAGRTLTVLATTSEAGYRQPDTIGLDRIDPPSGEMETIPLIVLLEGPMTSYWDARPGTEPAEEEPAGEEPADGEGADAEPPEEGQAPAGEGAAEEEPAEEDAPEEAPADEEPAGTEAAEEAPAPDEMPAEADEEPSGPPHLASGSGRLVVLTDAELVDDLVVSLSRRYRPGYDVGFPFVQNLVEWMTGTEELLSVRAKGRKPRLFDEPIEGSEQKLLTWINILVVPLLLLFVGIVVFIVRRVQPS